MEEGGIREAEKQRMRDARVETAKIRKGEGDMAIKIIIKRKVPKGKEEELVPLLVKLRSLATAQTGYVSGETLINVNDPEDYLVISTWQSVDHWKAWAGSKERSEIQDKIDALLGQKTEYGVYFYG